MLGPTTKLGGKSLESGPLKPLGTGKFTRTCSGTTVPSGQVTAPPHWPSWFQSTSRLTRPTVPDGILFVTSMSTLPPQNAVWHAYPNAVPVDWGHGVIWEDGSMVNGSGMIRPASPSR